MGPWSGETGTVRTSRTLGKGKWWRDRLSAVHRSQHCGEWLLSSYGALLDLLWLTAFNKLLMASDSGFRHLFSLFFFIVAMISTCGQDRLAGMISSFPMALGLSGCSWKSMQVQRTVLARGIPAGRQAVKPPFHFRHLKQVRHCLAEPKLSCNLWRGASRGLIG